MGIRTVATLAAFLLTALLLTGNGAAQSDTGAPHVVVQTELGDIEIEVDRRRAPGTAANFLKYVDAGHYDGGTFHRTVKMDNQPDNQIKIEVIQAGVNPDRTKDGFPPIPLERTNKTGLLHKDGAVSMARGGADSRDLGVLHLHQRSAVARFRRQRNADGQGFAAFGRVVSRHGRRAQDSTGPNTDAQRLTPPIKIIAVVRR